MPDKFAATWVSHSSISDYRECPRAYFLKNVYKDSKTRNKMKIMTPALALGAAVHETLEALSTIPRDRRLGKPLQPQFDTTWEKFTGKHGGFTDDRQENEYKNRGRAMIARAQDNPGPLAGLAVKIQQDLPHYWLSEEDEIVLCGKVDWLEYLEADKTVHIIDFKTGKNKEAPDSLQLPIYLLLVSHCQEHPVTHVSYWYLETDDAPSARALPNAEEAQKRVLEVARKIKLARQLKKYDCPNGGCRACTPFERVLTGEGEHVGNDDYGADVYILPPQENRQQPQSVIL